jgi:phosphopantothenoylcysteine decarboxylase
VLNNFPGVKPGSEIYYMRILLGITGSIAAIHMPFYLIYLKGVFPCLKIIISETAKRFVSKETLGLLGCRIYSDLFPQNGKSEMSHAQLAKWAELFIILPATANILAETAHGLAGSLLTTTILCHEKPVMFFPNMNDSMWNSPATQRNVSILREYGHTIIPPVEQFGYEHARGKQHKGGYMPSPVEIVNLLQAEAEKRKSYEAQNV